PPPPPPPAPGAPPCPGWPARRPVWGTAAVLVAGTATDDPPVSVMSMRSFQHVGDLSYSIYLWHWPILLLGQPKLSGWLDGWLGTAALLVLTLALAELSYRFVETPFQHGRIPKVKTRFALTLWPVSVALVLVAASLASNYGNAQLEQSREQASDYYEKHPAALKQPPEDRIEKKIRSSLALADEGAPVPPNLANGDDLGDDVWQQQFSCFAGFDDSSARICPMGDTEADKTVVLLGDSHAGMWLYALDRVGKEEGFKVLPLLKLGCAPYDVEQTFREDPFPSCPEFRDWSRDQVKKIQPDAIVLGHRGLNYVVPEDGESDEQAWHRGVEKTVTELAALSPQVKVLSDIPPLPWNPKSCITDPESTMKSCTAPVEGIEIESNPITRQAVADTGTDAEFVPVLKLVCQSGRCPIVVGDTVTYRDTSHLSITWTKAVAQEFGALLDLDDL
ncbi:MAG: hypothetical protein L0H93_19070, partial [Nocardioides sp.]|nr:hypothetical protein [Nocardioides sp.]